MCQKPEYTAVAADHKPGDPVGRGSTETKAMNDLMWKLSRRDSGDKRLTP